MEIKKIDLKDVFKEFGELKPDLLDECAIYYGAYIKDDLVGVVSYVEHPNTIYLCHAYVKEDYRNRGVYKLLWEYRNMKVKDLGKTITAHCNVSSLKHFLDNGYKIEKALFKVYK